MTIENNVVIPELMTREHVMPSELENYRLNFYGNKKRLLRQILDAIPRGTKTVADLFSGTGIVSWVLKHQGYKVISNDIMKWPVSRAVVCVGNHTTVLSEADIEMLCSGQRKRGKMSDLLEFYKRTFGEDNCRFLEAWTKNLPKLDSITKKFIAIYVVVVCISEHFSYAAVHWSKLGIATGSKFHIGVDLEKQVREYALNEFPKFLFDNGMENEVHNEDAVELVSKIEADVLYLDPPYCTSGGDYEANYSIFDDLVMMLAGSGHKVVDPSDSKATLNPYTYFGSRTSAINGLAQIFENCRHIPTVIVSYNSNSKIHPAEISKMARVNGRDVLETVIKDVHLASVGTGDDRPSKTDEYLIQCHRKAA